MTTAIVPRTTAQILRSAADRIATRGHAKHYFCDPRDGSYCATGAIYVELGWMSDTPAAWIKYFAVPVGEDITGPEPIRLVWEAAGRPDYSLPTLQLQVARWNNQSARTADEVIAVLRKAARMAEAKQQVENQPSVVEQGQESAAEVEPELAAV